MLDRGRLGRCHVERTRERDRKALAAPAEHARELAGAPVGDRERGAVVTDVDDDLRSRRLRAVGRQRRGESAERSERLEVDATESDAGLLARLDVTVDEL